MPSSTLLFNPQEKKIEAENSCAVVKFGGLGIDYRF